MTDPTAIDIVGRGDYNDPYTRTMHGWTAHGNFHLDAVPFITKVMPGLYHGGVESGLALPTNIDYVLSLYPWEEYTVFHKIVDSLRVEMLDSVTQDLGEIDSLARMVNRWRQTGSVLVHCQAGLNRSSLVVARALFLSGEFDDGQQIINWMREKRSEAVLCNPAFEAWVQGFKTEE